MTTYGIPFKVNPTPAPQKLNYSTTSATTATAFNAQTYVIRLVASTDCWIRFGDSTVTVNTTNGVFVKANWTPEYFSVAPGQYIAAVRDANDGSLYITEMTR